MRNIVQLPLVSARHCATRFDKLRIVWYDLPAVGGSMGMQE